jgi:hypothetical protein
MAIFDETRVVERLQYFNGQRLFASDLQGIEAFNREMRWLHNHSLHQPGIGNGFTVSGQKGDRQVSIGAGYAIDARGREIVLTQAHLEPVPPVSGEDDGQSVFYDLTVSYPEDDDLEEAETRAGICQDRGVVRLREEPEFCWVRLQRDELGNLKVVNTTLKQQIEGGLRLVVARAEVLNCQLRQPLSIAQRRSARPPRQPYVACGMVTPEPWNDWHVESGSENSTIGLMAEIDTTQAGFLTTPCYSLRIDGPRITVVTSGEVQTPILIISSAAIQNPRPTGFTAEVIVFPVPLTQRSSNTVSHIASLPILLATGAAVIAGGAGENLATGAQTSIFAEALDFAKVHWRVVWLGVED